MSKLFLYNARKKHSCREKKPGKPEETPERDTDGAAALRFLNQHAVTS